MPDPDALLSRAKVAEALTAAGFPTSKATLATIASRRVDGPLFRHFGPRVLYRWGDALDWAKARLSEPMSKTDGTV
jgi:hypothetical protein